MSRWQKSNTRRTRTLSITVTPEEYEAIFQVAAHEGISASSWARDVLLSRALRVRWMRQAA